MVTVQDCVIERRDGPTCCGLLFYLARSVPFHLSWTADMGNSREVVIKIFPPAGTGQTVTDHYQVLAEAILDKILA